MPFVVIEYATDEDLRKGKTQVVLAGIGEARTAEDLARFALGRLTGRELSDEDLAPLLTTIRKKPRPRVVTPYKGRGPSGKLLAKEP